MKRITIEVENDFHKTIKLRALELDKTTKDYVLELIKKDLKERKKYKMSQAIVAQTVIYEEKEHYVNYPFRDIHDKYKKALIKKMDKSNRQYGGLPRSSIYYENQIYENVRRVAVLINGTGRVSQLGYDDLQLSRVIMEGIYQYLIYGKINLIKKDLEKKEE